MGYGDADALLMRAWVALPMDGMECSPASQGPETFPARVGKAFNNYLPSSWAWGFSSV